MGFGLQCDAFGNGQPIPARFTCDGQGISPHLTWKDEPAGTGTYALICDDPDAPGGIFTHWIVCNIPAGIHELPSGAPRTMTLPQGAIEGRNSFGNLSYGGPCPPKAHVHRYRFTLYSLDVPLSVTPGVLVEQVRIAMQGHVLDFTTLEGTYQRAAGSPAMAASGAAGRP
jgi:Raf kinase inhibitor-like YbhB/YbcL family protein